MKNGFNSISRAVALMLLLWLASCSTQTQKEEKDEEGIAIKDTSDENESEIRSFEGVDATAKIQINGFLTDYFAINQMLIKDDQQGAKTAAQKLSESIKKFEMANLTAEQMDFYLTQSSKLNQGIRGIADGTDIEKMRMELATLSEGLYALVKAFHPNESALYYQFCPMARNGKGANWLSGTKEIVNPYMGQMMPACGKTQETIQ